MKKAIIRWLVGSIVCGWSYVLGMLFGYVWGSNSNK